MRSGFSSLLMALAAFVVPCTGLHAQPHSTLSDFQIRSAVEDALARDALTATADIQVEVTAGKVELRGHADTVLAGHSAEEIASGVEGVHAVENHLIMDSGRRPPLKSPNRHGERDAPMGAYLPAQGRATGTQDSDRRIEAGIRDQFWWNPFVDQRDIDVTVMHGVATLNGVVGSRAEKSAAAEEALEGGARSVVNLLRVAD